MIDRIEGGKRFRKQDKLAPFFSVITICYNNINNIDRCINSVISQSFKDYEYIIIDGGSDDGTINIVRDYEDCVDYFVSEGDTGVYNAINKGIIASNGDVIVLVHADDQMAHNSLSRVYNVFKTNSCDMVLGDFLYHDDFGRIIQYKPARDYGEECIFRGMVAGHEAMFIRRKLYDKFGLYDERLKIAADLKLTNNMILGGARTAKTGRVELYKEVGGSSFKKNVQTSEDFFVMKEHIPDLSTYEHDILSKLKNYIDANKDDLLEIYKLINSSAFGGFIYKSLALTFLTKMMGDSVNVSFLDDENSPFYRRQSFRKDRILLGISSLKNVSGGAEKVLSSIANYLVDNDIDVLVTSAEGKAANPFYKLDEGVDLVDILEPPNNRFLQSSYNLDSEIRAIISEIPDEILFVVFSGKLHRDRFSNWSQFSSFCRETTRHDASYIREKLLSEVQMWCNRYGERVRRWRRLIEEYKPGIVVPFMISCSTYLFIAARGTPSVVKISNHGNPIRDYLYQDDWDNSMLDRALRFYALIKANNVHWLQKDFIGMIPAQSARKSIVINNPIDIDKKFKADTISSKRILSIGRFVDVKRTDLLIKAFARASKFLPGWSLHIYGSGPGEPQLRRLISELELSEIVTLHNPTKKIGDAYKVSSLYITCSEREGFPLTVGEALRCGLPVIGSRQTSGVNFLVKDGFNGILVDGEDDDVLIIEFSNALTYLCKNIESRKSFANNAVISVSEFTPANIMPKWKKFLGV